MIGIILASHGKLAEGMLDSLHLFAGEKIPQTEAIILGAEDSPDLFDEKLKLALEKVETGQGTVIFCDLLFGTPCNRSAAFINEKTKVICGMNLPVILEFIGMRSTVSIDQFDWKELLKTGAEGLCDLEDKI